jgi:hypothetical protein
LDRVTGEFLWGSPILHQNVVLDISPEGRVQANAVLRHREAGQSRLGLHGRGALGAAVADDLGYTSPTGSSTVFVFALPPSLRE